MFYLKLGLVPAISFFIALGSSAMAQPAMDQLELFRTAKTVRIVVEQSYGDAENISLEFEESTRRFIEYAGLKTVEDDAESCDMTIEIVAIGNALSATYKWPVGHRYTGAFLSGSISFQTSGAQNYTRDFEGRQDVSEVATEDFSTAPEMSLFLKPYRESFVKEMIEMMGEVYGVDFFLAVLSDSHWSEKQYAAEILGRMRDPNTVERLIDSLQDEDESVRRYAILALGKIGDSRAVEPLIDVFFEDKSTRSAAGNALGEIRDSRAVEPLVDALETREYRLYAIQALGKLGDPRAVESLIRMLDREEEWNRESAERALARITGEDFGQDIEKWQDWWVENEIEYLKNR